MKSISSTSSEQIEAIEFARDLIKFPIETQYLKHYFWVKEVKSKPRAFEEIRKLLFVLKVCS